MLMFGSEIMEGRLLDGFLDALRGLPEVQAELIRAEQPGVSDRGHDASG